MQMSCQELLPCNQKIMFQAFADVMHTVRNNHQCCMTLKWHAQAIGHRSTIRTVRASPHWQTFYRGISLCQNLFFKPPLQCNDMFISCIRIWKTSWQRNMRTCTIQYSGLIVMHWTRNFPTPIIIAHSLCITVSHSTKGVAVLFMQG